MTAYLKEGVGDRDQVENSDEGKKTTARGGILALRGMHDAEGKPVLFVACNDNSVHLYDLPSFSERGKIFAKKEVRAIQIGPDGLFFTGDGTGELKVWKWVASDPTSA
ncbi:uncharacterized protein A4U43_C10F9970 [Asparagus officinalis]|uniref:Uncharacterized protein n=1 Tax=Asparagus officinalis TaxID=4686 RepID=A0A5P1E1S6_ASPOF|nr:uncharacterized protein A4U43_C10F9970 [Asparagus officinalis]